MKNDQVENIQRETVKDKLEVAHYKGGLPSNQEWSTMWEMSTSLVKANSIVHKSVEDLMAAVIYGRELGFDYLTSANNIYVIKGKLTASKHLYLMAAQRDQSVWYEITRNHERVYPGKGGTEFYTGDIKEDPDKFHFLSVSSDGKVSPQVEGKTNLLPHTDFVTTIEFFQMKKLPDGTFKTMKVVESFYLSEAITAGWMAEKDNWKHHTRSMMESRCFTRGLSKLGILGGLPSTEDILDITPNADYVLNSDGTIKAITTK